MSSPAAERRSRARCSASSVGWPPRARSVSKTPSPSWNPRSKTDRCGAVGRQELAIDPDVARSPRRPIGVTRPPRRRSRPSGPRALATVSSHSAAGSLPQVMPPPTWSVSRRPSATNVRIRMLVCIAPSGPIQPSAPVYGPRRTGSRPSRISIARIFGRTGDRAAGEATPRAGRTRRGRREAGRSRSRRGAGRRPSARAGTGAARGPCPARQTRPRSLRRTSTIITFSARSLALASSSQASARSSARSRPRGRVPLIGSVATTPVGVDRQERLGRRRQQRPRPARLGRRPEVEVRGEQRRVAGPQAPVRRPTDRRRTASRAGGSGWPGRCRRAAMCSRTGSTPAS